MADAASSEVLTQVASRALERHRLVYEDEVRRLLEAGLEVMEEFGTARSPRIADILERAGLSRDAFYRHFASKEDLVAAVVRAGTARLEGYIAHQMAKRSTPAERIEAWIAAVMSQAMDPTVAAATRAVLWNGGRVPDASRTEGHDSATALSRLLLEPLGDAGRPDPDRDARAVAHAVFGTMRTFLESAAAPDGEDLEHLVTFCLTALGIHRAQKKGGR